MRDESRGWGGEGGGRSDPLGLQWHRVIVGWEATQRSHAGGGGALSGGSHFQADENSSVGDYAVK